MHCRLACTSFNIHLVWLQCINLIISFRYGVWITRISVVGLCVNNMWFSVYTWYHVFFDNWCRTKTVSFYSLSLSKTFKQSSYLFGAIFSVCRGLSKGIIFNFSLLLLKAFFPHKKPLLPVFNGAPIEFPRQRVCPALLLRCKATTLWRTDSTCAEA